MRRPHRQRKQIAAPDVSAAVFLAAWWSLATAYGNRGLWISFIVCVVARAVALLRRLPALRASLDGRPATATE